MGEATYYLRARFKTESEAAEVFPAFVALNREGVESADYWQSHRGEEREGFFAAFNVQFPLVASCLGSHTFDSNNGLAGVLEFIDPDQLYCQKRDIGGSDCLWHFASLELLENWLYERGALCVVWLSDEYVEISELLKDHLDANELAGKGAL